MFLFWDLRLLCFSKGESDNQGGTNEIGEATAEKMKEFRLDIWGIDGFGEGMNCMSRHIRRNLPSMFGLSL